MTREFDTPIDTFYDFGYDAAKNVSQGFEDRLIEQGGAFFKPELAKLDPDSIAYVDLLEIEGEEALLQEIENNERLRKERERAAKEKLDLEIATINALADIKMSEVDIVETVFRTIGDLSESNRFIQALALVGESAAGIAKIIIDTQAGNAALRLQAAAFPPLKPLAKLQIKANNVAAAAGIAANVGATATALAKLKAPVSPPSTQGVGGGGDLGGEQAPQFNVVGAAGQNQLAAAIASTQGEPVKAYVVAGDVTTAQQLDRNIIQGASIG
jgi:hypothetical protein